MKEIINLKENSEDNLDSQKIQDHRSLSWTGVVVFFALFTIAFSSTLFVL